MHPACYGYLVRTVLSLPPRRSVLEIGSRDVNGSLRQLFMGGRYLGIDIAPGDGVDVVADAATFTPDFAPDTVVCCEVLEHAENAGEIVANAVRMLAPGGVLIMTCATDPRAPHSAEDGAALRDGEYYRNVPADLYRRWLWPLDAYHIEIDERLGDLRAVAVKN